MARTAILGLMVFLLGTVIWHLSLIDATHQQEKVRKTVQTTEYKIWIDNRRAEMEEGYVSQKCAR